MAKTEISIGARNLVIPEDCGLVQEKIPTEVRGDIYEAGRYVYCQRGDCGLMYGEGVSGRGVSESEAVEDADKDTTRIMERDCIILLPAEPITP